MNNSRITILVTPAPSPIKGWYVKTMKESDQMAYNEQIGFEHFSKKEDAIAYGEELKRRWPGAKLRIDDA